MSKLADLHIHTFYSDSTSSPQEVIQQAHQAGLHCIAITDHDTVDGIVPTMEAARELGLEVIAGVELSSEINGKDIHILGYCFDYQNENLLSRLNEMQNTRLERMKQMISKLHAVGIKNIELEEVTSRVQSKSVGRPHLAAVLVAKGKVSTMQAAFDKYLTEGAVAYVPKFKMSPVEAIELINSAGGVAVLAHPVLTAVDELIPQFVRAGLKGIEVFYPMHTENVIHFYQGIVQKHHLVATGGSDAHGSAKRHTYVGRVKIPYEYVEQLKKAAGK
jgi:predicted metal-dependent phosphoesterase TrpH